jgi:hypothetical protein
MIRFPLSPVLAAGALAAAPALAQDAPPSLSMAALAAAGPATVSTRVLEAAALAFGDDAASEPEPSLAPGGGVAEAVRALAAAQGGLRPAAEAFAADFAVAAAGPAPAERAAPHPAPAADEGLAAAGGFDLGPRLRLDFESGLSYAFSASLTGVIGYGDVSTDEGADISLDGPSLGFTFRF